MAIQEGRELCFKKILTSLENNLQEQQVINNDKLSGLKTKLGIK